MPVHQQVAVKVLEHGDEFTGCTEDGGRDRDSHQLDASGRRAALLEGAMTSTIKHPNVRVSCVDSFDARVSVCMCFTCGLGKQMQVCTVAVCVYVLPVG
jgi:hypothetical protein